MNANIDFISATNCKEMTQFANLNHSVHYAPQSLMGYIARKANEVKRCPKVKQNMRINMALTILDNIVRFKRNLKKLFGSKAEIWLSPQNLHCKISIFSNEKKSRA